MCWNWRSENQEQLLFPFEYSNIMEQEEVS